jgi:hypothetical protein
VHGTAGKFRGGEVNEKLNGLCFESEVIMPTETDNGRCSVVAAWAGRGMAMKMGQYS